MEKRLPSFRDVAELVHTVGGIVSAAHLKERGTRAMLNAGAAAYMTKGGPPEDLLADQPIARDLGGFLVVVARRR